MDLTARLDLLQAEAKGLIAIAKAISDLLCLPNELPIADRDLWTARAETYSRLAKQNLDLAAEILALLNAGAPPRQTIH